MSVGLLMQYAVIATLVAASVIYLLRKLAHSRDCSSGCSACGQCGGTEPDSTRCASSGERGESVTHVVQFHPHSPQRHPPPQ
jgi:hypothetical protein